MLPQIDPPPLDTIRKRLERLYPSDAGRCLHRLRALLGRYGVLPSTDPPPADDGIDSILIVYPDMIRAPDEPPLRTLAHFANTRLRHAFSAIHLLPFFPSSSDGGFAVIDHREVDPRLGSWSDVALFAQRFDLMFDLVLNHVSSQNRHFLDYLAGIAPGRHFFIETDPATDLSATMRPRAAPLLREFTTRHGRRALWCTFGPDQIDLDYSNPDVLFETLDLLVTLIARGASLIRLDAVAFLWKRPGTSCVHLPETHEIVRLLRDVLGIVAPHARIITETNVPHADNVSYLGQGDEAHMIYQFPLPPILLHALLRGDSSILTRWVASLPEPPRGCATLNFTASHDGIGLLPAHGILPREEIEFLADRIRHHGGRVSSRTLPDGSIAPYELNSTYFDALNPPESRDSPIAARRFLASQYVTLALRGIPAIYFHNLLASPNDIAAADASGQNRDVHRARVDREQLAMSLSNPDSVANQIFTQLTHVLRSRRRYRAFHPDAPQQVLNLGPALFGIRRIAPDGSEAIYCISNFTPQQIRLHLDGELAQLHAARSAREIISGTRAQFARGDLTFDPYETLWLVLPTPA